MRYEVTQEQLLQLTRIYNTLMGVEVKGENAILLTDCLRATQQLIQDMQKNPVISDIADTQDQ